MIKKVTHTKKMDENNHYIIPDCVKAYSGEPLYILISRWCLYEKRWITCQDVSIAFKIPYRRASFQLSYINKKKERVKCKIRYSTESIGQGLKLEVFVESIKEIPGALFKNESKMHSSGATVRRVGNAMMKNSGIWDKLLKKVR
ncbi:TPA: CaiF/GrlA family transcriptional regulator [Salmonella enterica]|nr:CaiF/GrlA family transcriptional regulator [Salmonella enterica]